MCSDSKKPPVKKERLKRFRPERIAQAITDCHGLVFVAAKRLGCHHDTIYKAARQYPCVASALESSRGQMLDMAEGKLSQAVNAGEAWAICFFLKTQGKGRGYVERTETTDTVAAEREAERKAEQAAIAEKLRRAVELKRVV